VLRNFLGLNIAILYHNVTQTLRTLPWVQQKAKVIFKGISNINISSFVVPYLGNFQGGMSVKGNFSRISKLDAGGI